jgi:hypothetical protein
MDVVAPSKGSGNKILFKLYWLSAIIFSKFTVGSIVVTSTLTVTSLEKSLLSPKSKTRFLPYAVADNVYEVPSLAVKAKFNVTSSALVKVLTRLIRARIGYFGALLVCTSTVNL